ncbi:hypothetical protein BGX24_006790 [Mortierella sp. AD032]|nr:hypothetical protein BGX24_006790 [Mortierella sp. AD032]
MYGRGSVAWSALMLDSKFYVDYNLASDNSPCGDWWKIVDQYSKDAISMSQENSRSLEKDYVSGYAVGCALTFGAGQVKQRREQEVGRTVAVRRGGVVWEDKKLWASYMLVDGGVAQLALAAGGCAEDLATCGINRLMNDVIDLGYDWGSGDMCNGILTLSEGRSSRVDLALAYTKTTAVLNRLRRMRSDSVGSVSLITAHAWQMCNNRHRIIACALVSDETDLGPTTYSATWHEAVILGNLCRKIEHVMHDGMLEYEPGLTAKARLTDRSWAALKKDTSGCLSKILYYGHQWLVENRRAKIVPSAIEIEKIEDILRCTVLEAAMEMDRADYVEALWCWTIESWCATDMMWHAMIGSTAMSSDRNVGSDRWDDTNNMAEWKEL